MPLNWITINISFLRWAELVLLVKYQYRQQMIWTPKKVCHEEDGFRPDKRHHLDELVNGRRLLRRVDREPSRLVLVVVWIPAPDVVPVTLKYLAEFFDLMLPNLLPGLNHFKCSLYSPNSPFGEHFVQESQKKLISKYYKHICKSI